ncbi:MAG: DNA methyltransferase [Longimicrobiales bacterium]
MGDRERVVVETDATRKRALADLLRDRGVTVSDWFEEQLDLLIAETPRTYPDGEVEVPPADPVASLQDVDWAFSSADTTYLSHDIHPYPAKFIPQIPAALIRRLSRRGDLVLDPFGGSGTTALEAIRLGRRALSIDANPLAELVGRVKIGRLDNAASRQLNAFRTLMAGHALSPPEAGGDPGSIAEFIPDVPNIEKWFAPSAVAELALIRAKSENLDGLARDIARLALSRIVVSASFQDSETRYASKPRDVEPGATLAMYIAALDATIRRVEHAEPAVRYGLADFITANAQELRSSLVPDSSVDLVVTSPPYGNATDYHLYHRFRIFWLGFDPRDFGRIEIGSHLRHQRDGTGFEDYIRDLLPVFEGVGRVLKPGGFAAVVIGDSVYNGEAFASAESLSEGVSSLGLETVELLTRPLPEFRRSFSAAARRATEEKILVLRRPVGRERPRLVAPAYKLWPFEKDLRRREAVALVDCDPDDWSFPGQAAHIAKRLVFSHGIRYPGGFIAPTWQRILENGYSGDESGRKDPKYATHGIHRYKGKFYPQLAKSLLNSAGLDVGATVLDPFCGSGTLVLEGHLSGLRAHGVDLNPLAARIASAKVGVLDLDPNHVLRAAEFLRAELTGTVSCTGSMDQFPEAAHEEIESWFATPIAFKLNHVLSVIRASSTGVLQEFLEVVFSSIVRDVSHQDPRDLRIRRRKEPLDDADVFGAFLGALDAQVERLEDFWAIRGHCPTPLVRPTVVHGDAREGRPFDKLGLRDRSVDCVLTSPPYATALPYIDTDRLSLLLLFGLTSSDRRPLERDLTGSREITASSRRALEAEIRSPTSGALPGSVERFLIELLVTTEKAEVGFRRQNRPSLLLRFFSDLSRVLAESERLLRPGGHLFMVIGDSSTRIAGEDIRIPTTDLSRDIAEHLGMRLVDEFSIDVTTEDMKHAKNSITENRVIRLVKEGRI